MMQTKEDTYNDNSLHTKQFSLNQQLDTNPQYEMCGILAYQSTTSSRNITRAQFVEANNLLKHRGPDDSRIWEDERKVFLGHNRLAIMSVNHGAQPIIKDNVIVCVNGEIYNYKAIAKCLEFDATDVSDCETIYHLYKKYGPSVEAVQQLDGMFSFVLYDKTNEILWCARDPFGITSLYFAYSEDVFVIASEMKSIQLLCHEPIEEFQPGTMMIRIKSETLTEIYHQPFMMQNEMLWQENSMMDYKDCCKMIRDSLCESVRKRMMTDVPFGVLLSGGLDSSLIAAIVQHNQRNQQTKQTELENEVKEKIVLTDTRLQSFSVGLEGSPDHKAAQIVADFIGAHHHAIIFTVEEALDVVEQVIYHLETYDVTTIRASTPMFLLSRAIKARGIKMVLSGEGSDEIFGGYLYFHQAPDEKSFKDECIRRVRDLHLFDCLRANKSTMAWGLEVRVPFLDKTFVDLAMQVPTANKMCGRDKIEKKILRDAFEGWLPEEILWRQKEQFSVS